MGQGSNGDIPTLNLTLRGAEEEDPLVVRSCTWPAFAAGLGSLTSLSSGAWRRVDVDMIGWETDRSDGLDELDGLEGDGWLFGSCIRSRVKAGGVSVSGRVKKRTRQVLKRNKRSKPEGETDGRRNELHLPTCLMNVPAGGMQRRVKGSGSPGRGGMAGRQRSGKERLYGCRDTCCASKRRVAGEKGGAKDRAGQSVPPHSYIHNASRRVPRPSFLASCTVGRAAAVEDGRCR